METAVDISEVAGSLKYGLFGGKALKVLLIILDVCAALLLLIGALVGILAACGVEQPDKTEIIVLCICPGIGVVIFIAHLVVHLRKGRHIAYFYRALEAGDLQRASAKIYVTTDPVFTRFAASPATATLRFKLNGKKYEKRNIGLPARLARYTQLDVLYSPSCDALFYLKEHHPW